MAYNSTIKQKMCKCGCGAFPTLGFKGWNRLCAPKELRQTVTRKAQATAERSKSNAIARNLHKQQQARTEEGKKETEAKIALKRAREKGKPKSDGRADLLQSADLRFSRYMRNKYSNEAGDIICPLCYGKYNIQDRLEGSETVVQVLHFIPRGVMSLRFAEGSNVIVGCTYCNLDMNLHPTGKPWQRYRAKLVSELGEEKVLEMEAEKYKVNKVSHAYLKEICEIYDPRKHPVKTIQPNLED